MTALPPGLVQPDGRSCGAACLVAARMLVDPDYATLVTSGTHPGTGMTVAGTTQERFGRETLAMHRRVTGAAVLGGGKQLPWPRVVGTPPWAVAHQLGATGGPGLDPTPYDMDVVRALPGDAGLLIRRGLGLRRPVAVFVGDRWLPRHVVLAVDATGDSIDCYDPARGRVVAASTRAFTDRRLPFGPWTHVWFVVSPA